MEQTTENARKDALSFLTNHKTGVLSTVSGQGHALGSMVYYVADEQFNVYILTLATSRKFGAIEEHPQVAFTVANPDIPQTLQLEGIGMDISLDEEGNQKRQELLEVLSSNPWFYGPPAKLDPAQMVVVWIRPTWVRWADYAFAPAGTEHVLKEIPLK